MKKILLLLAVTTFNISLAQTPSWTWAKNITTYTSSKQNISAIDNEGNVYLVGDFNVATATIGDVTLTNESDAGYSDAYIFKFTNQGNLLWHKQISTNKTETISGVTTDSAGNFYIIGTIGNNITLGTTALTVGHNPYYIAKLNSDGDFLWAIKDTGVADNYYFNDIEVDNSGNVFVSGASRSATVTFGSVLVSIDPQHVTVSNPRAFILKFNAEGVSQWGRMGTSDEANIFGTLPASMTVDNSGGVVLCGTFAHNTLHFGAITLTKGITSNSSDVFIVKYDADGAELWAHSAGSTTYQINTRAQAVTTDINNNVYFGGTFAYDLQFGSATLQATAGVQFFLVKYNVSGVPQWATTPQSADNATIMGSLATDQLGNVYAAGLTYASNIHFSSTIKLLNLGSVGSFFVTKYTDLGTPVWTKGVTNLDANNDISIHCKAENDLIVSGTFESTALQIGSTILTKSGTGRDVYIARLYAQPLSTKDFDANSVLVYPNPVRDILYVSNLDTNATYELYNIFGSTIQKGIITMEKAYINMSALQSGIYIMKLLDDNGKHFEKKIIVQ